MEKTVKVKGIHCAGCANSVERALSELNGVSEASVNIATEKATVSYNGDLTFDSLRKVVQEAGYDLIEEEKYDSTGITDAKELRKAKYKMWWAWGLTIPRNGILIRRVKAVQKLREVDTIVLDKTGTITKGEPSVSDIVSVNLDEKTILRYAASAERGSEHPVGRSIVEFAVKSGIDIPEADEFEAIPGKGIRAVSEKRSIIIGTRKLFEEYDIEISEDIRDKMGGLDSQAKTSVLVGIDGEVAGVISVADQLKEDSIKAIKALKKMGFTPIILTGDNEETARAIAREVGVEEVIAEVMPDQKSNKIAELQKAGSKVAMIGDGINDAPALTHADVGIAIGTGTDIAI